MAIYTHFGSMDELKREVRRQGYGALRRRDGRGARRRMTREQIWKPCAAPTTRSRVSSRTCTA